MKKFSTRDFVVMAALAGILLVMNFTPLGYLNIGPFAITLNVIPVAIAAIALGPVGGAIAGAVFGLTSLMQAMGIGGLSATGSMLFSIDPWREGVLCFVPRILDGLVIGFVYEICRKRLTVVHSCIITGFLAAFLNTTFFMSGMVLLFGNTEYVKGLIDGRNVLIFVLSFVGINAAVEIMASTIITSAVGPALIRSGLIKRS